MNSIQSFQFDISYDGINKMQCIIYLYITNINNISEFIQKYVQKYIENRIIKYYEKTNINRIHYNKNFMKGLMRKLMVKNDINMYFKTNNIMFDLSYECNVNIINIEIETDTSRELAYCKNKYNNEIENTKKIIFSIDDEQQYYVISMKYEYNNYCIEELNRRIKELEN